MTLIAHPKQLSTSEIARSIQRWLDERGFETKVLESDGMYAVKARKASALRAVIGADRALEVQIRTTSSDTQVDVRQGSWKTNVVSNAVWLVVTGGTNLLFSGWSLVIQKELEGYIRTVLDELAGVREVKFSP